MFLETTFKDSKKVKIIKNYVLKYNRYLHFLIQQKLLIFAEKMLMLAKLKGSGSEELNNAFPLPLLSCDP